VARSQPRLALASQHAAVGRRLRPCERINANEALAEIMVELARAKVKPGPCPTTAPARKAIRASCSPIRARTKPLFQAIKNDTVAQWLAQPGDARN
jgi:hypothetical protein